MSRQRYNLMLVLAAAVGLIVVHEYGPQGLYSFRGHAREMFDLVLGLLWLLFLTHAGLAVIMWLQRKTWDPADSAAFLFVAIHALFWIDLAETAVRRGGQNLTTVYLFCVIFLSTVYLDVQLFHRYVVFRGDEATDLRQGDAIGTAHVARVAEHAAAWMNGDAAETDAALVESE
jgi:hypothetical protein